MRGWVLAALDVRRFPPPFHASPKLACPLFTEGRFDFFSRLCYISPMRVLLISANIERLPDPVAPLGLAYLASALKRDSHDVQVLDLCFEEEIEEALKRSLSDFAPQAIGLSLRNIDNVAYPDSISYLPFYRELVEICRRFSRSPIFLGGSGFTLLPDPILGYLGADAGIAGEGEEAFPQALRRLTGNANPPPDGPPVPLGGDPWKISRISDFDSLPSPDWEGVDLKRYFRQGGMGNLQTKRGCPFQCLYCTYPLIEGEFSRLRSPGKVAEEARAIIDLGVDHAFVVDNIFNYPQAHAREVCRAFIDQEIPLRWSCYAHPAHLSPSLAEDMKKAGCTGLEFGTDSGAPEVLARLKKNFTPLDIRNASQRAREAGLEVCHSLSLGAPGETMETLQTTFDLMEEISPTAVIAMLGLRIFPGTGLAALALEEGMISPSHNFMEPAFYIAPAVRDRLVEVARRKAADHPNWIFPGLTINISTRLQSKLRRIGVKGPLWEHMKILPKTRAWKRVPDA